jgi:tRNA pseudouridine38-40 synthase
MANYKLLLEYDGSGYHGFQRQPGLPTVQGELEKALLRLASLDSPLYAAGRTDAGVHARGQVVNFHAGLRVPLPRLAPALNALLPRDIAVREAEEVPDAFHARRDAASREYRYFLLNRPVRPVLGRAYLLHYPHALDLEGMRRACGLLRGVHDFRSFCREEKGRTCVREVLEASCEDLPGDVVCIRVRANAFAYMMMRMLCAALLEVGRGRWEPERLMEVMDSRDNSLCPPTLPPHGLVLEKVYFSGVPVPGRDKVTIS